MSHRNLKIVTAMLVIRHIQVVRRHHALVQTHNELVRDHNLLLKMWAKYPPSVPVIPIVHSNN